MRRKPHPWQITALIFLFSISVPSQETQSALQIKTEEAELRARLAKAQKDEFEAKFPIPDADSFKGTSKIDGKLIESQIQTYRAIDSIARSISVELKKIKILKNSKLSTGQVIPTVSRIKKLYLYRESDYLKVAQYRNIVKRLDLINSEYRKCMFQKNTADFDKSGGAAIAAKIALEAVQFLKTDSSLSGELITADEDAFIASFSNALAQNDINIRLAHPFVSGFQFIEIGDLENSRLISALSLAETGQASPRCENQDYKLKEQIDSAYVQLKKNIGLLVDSPEPRKKIKKTMKSDGTHETVEEMETGGDNRPEQIWLDHLMIEQIIGQMKNDGTYWIKLKLVSSGGNVRTKSNVVRDIPRGGPKIEFSGGAIANYFIFDNEGNTLASGIVNSYIPYSKSSQITRTDSIDKRKP